MNMISDRHNYDNGYIGLVNLPLRNLPETLEVEDYELLLKSEFHTSLICVKRVTSLIDADRAASIEAEIVNTFQDFIKTNPLTEYSLDNVYRLVRRDERVTLIEMVAMSGIESFFNALKEKYRTVIPLQPTHITLYTLQPDVGIGILSYQELENDSTVVDVPLFNIDSSVTR